VGFVARPYEKDIRNNVARQYVARLIFTFDVDCLEVVELAVVSAARNHSARFAVRKFGEIPLAHFLDSPPTCTRDVHDLAHAGGAQGAYVVVFGGVVKDNGVPQGVAEFVLH
jgi:hypothetical protein